MDTAPQPPPFPVIAIGTSFGGVEALLRLAAELPADLPAAIAVVVHIGPHPSLLPDLLRRAGPMRAVHAAEGEPIAAGTWYVAPPDRHLLLRDGHAHLSRGPRENHCRPAIDPLFRSVALGWGDRAIGVVLTGQLDDGTAGLAAIKSRGGVAVVQDPSSALAASMPASALANVDVDHCVPLHDLAVLLVDLARAMAVRAPTAPAEAAHAADDALLREQAIFDGDHPMENLAAIAAPSPLTCPECGGTMFELKDGPLRFRCHTGHAFTSLSLEDAQQEMAAHTMQASLRALREREMLLRRMAAVSRQIGDEQQAAIGSRQADRVRDQAASLERLMVAGDGDA